MCHQHVNWIQSAQAVPYIAIFVRYWNMFGDRGSTVVKVPCYIGRSLVRFQMVSLEFFIDIILPITLWTWGRLSLYQKWVPGVFPGGKGGRYVRLTTLPPSCAVVTKSGSLNFLELSGPVQACNGMALPFTGMFAAILRNHWIHWNLLLPHIPVRKWVSWQGSFLSDCRFAQAPFRECDKRTKWDKNSLPTVIRAINIPCCGSMK